MEKCGKSAVNTSLNALYVRWTTGKCSRTTFNVDILLVNRIIMAMICFHTAAASLWV